jgi:prolyl oligopeptidase
VREFDLEIGFVPGGFELPEAKTIVSWIDLDHIFAATDFGPGTLTTSGYSRIAKRWRRGTALADAEVVFEGQPDDVRISAEHDANPDFPRDLISRRIAFYDSETYILGSHGEITRVNVPTDVNVNVHRQWLLVRLRTPWTVEATTYPAGALLAVELDAFLGGDRRLTVLFEPAPR